MDPARLKWLLRRGMKELDVMVARYHDKRYPIAPPEERQGFERLLEQVEDPDLWAWCMGYAEPPSEYADVVRELRVHR